MVVVGAVVGLDGVVVGPPGLAAAVDGEEQVQVAVALHVQGRHRLHGEAAQPHRVGQGERLGEVAPGAGCGIRPRPEASEGLRAPVAARLRRHDLLEPVPVEVHEEHERGAVREAFHGQRDRHEAADPIVAEQERRLVAARGDEVVEPVAVEVHDGEAAEGQRPVPVHEVLEQPLILGAGPEGEANLDGPVHVACRVIALEPQPRAQRVKGSRLAGVEAREAPVLSGGGAGLDLRVKGDVHTLGRRGGVRGTRAARIGGRLRSGPAEASASGGTLS